MKQALTIFATSLLFGCGPAEPGIVRISPDSTEQMIPEFRDHPSPNPVVAYHKPIPNDLNGFVFDVKVFETKRTAVYKLDLQYKVLHVVDSFAVPVVEMVPEILIQPDSSKTYGCFVGLATYPQKFLRMKHIYVENDQLKVKTIAKIAVRTNKLVTE